MTVGVRKNPNNVTNTSFNTVHLLPKDLRFEHGAQWRTQKIFMGGFQSAKIFHFTKIESMKRKNIKQAAIQYVNVVKQL